MLSKEREKKKRCRKRKSLGEEDRLEKRGKMAAKGAGNTAGNMAGDKKRGGKGEEAVKRSRGRPRKGIEEGEGADAMRRFLESKGEEKAFEKSQKLKYTPEKNRDRREREGTHEDGEEGNTLIDDGQTEDKGGEGTKQRTTTREGNENDKTATTGDSGDSAANKAGEEEKKEDENGGMSGLIAEWMKASMERMRELKHRLDDVIDRLEERDKELEQLKVEREQNREWIEKLEKEITLLSVGQARDRGRINDMESKLDKIIKIKDVNENECECGKYVCEDKTRERTEGENNEREGGETDRDEVEAGRGDENASDECRGEGEGTGLGGVNRKYLHCIPTALGKGEYEREKEERANRKKNLMIKGIRTVGRGLKEEVKKVIKELMDVDIYIKRVLAIEGGLVVELESFKNKIEILKRKGRLGGIKLWIGDDFTKREKEVQEWLSMIAEEEGMRGHDTKVGYQKVRVDGEWFEWNERKGEVELVKFRGEKGE